MLDAFWSALQGGADWGARLAAGSIRNSVERLDQAYRHLIDESDDDRPQLAPQTWPDAASAAATANSGGHSSVVQSMPGGFFIALLTLAAT